jgi:para-aminobenzoate synthetase component I
MHKIKHLDFRYIEFESLQSIFDLYTYLGASKDSFLLDSSKEDSPYSNYSMIGLNPHLIVKYENRKIYVKDFTVTSLGATEVSFKVIKETDIFKYLNTILQDHPLRNDTHLPFVGGGIGFFNYELAKELEKLPHTAHSEVSLPDCYYVFYDNVVIKELKTSNVYITGLGLLKPSRDSIYSIKQTLDNAFANKRVCIEAPTFYPTMQPNTFVSTFSQESYMAAVNTMRDYIEEGHIYIANMTHTFKSEFTQDPLKTYSRLREINPAPFSAYMPFDTTTILCSSPERFIKINNGHVQTRPIKGTIPRGKTHEEDEDNQRLLMASEKDKSELLMIVDLERNDLSKVCKPGSVVVTELFEIETYATVFHLVATIEGQLKDENTAIDCMKATFPGGSITGAPKIRAMEIIDQLEPTTRNLYTGCIGYIGYDKKADFNIVIRTIVVKDSMAYIGVGGGITWESDPKSEYDETLQKAKALFNSLGMTEQ